MSQRTLVLLKPDAVRRGLIGEIVGRIERKADSTLTFSRYWDRGSSGLTLKAYELRVFCSFPRNRVLPGTSHYPCPRHLRLRLPDAVA